MTSQIQDGSRSFIGQGKLSASLSLLKKPMHNHPGCSPYESILGISSIAQCCPLLGLVVVRIVSRAEVANTVLPSVRTGGGRDCQGKLGQPHFHF